MIKNVRTTFNGRLREYTLAPKTVIVGPTGSGKTTLLASLGLLLTGHADDAVGRAQAAAGPDLALAMGEGSNAIEVDATAGDDTKLRYRLERGKRPVGWSGADDWRHPMRELRAILSQGVDAARKDMAPLLLGKDPVNLWRILPKQTHGEVPETLSLDEVSAKLERVRLDLQAESKMVTLLTSNVETLENALPSRPSPEQLAALRLVVEDRRRAESSVAAARGARAERRRQANAAVAAGQQRQADLRAAAAALSAEQANYPAALAAYQQAAAQAGAVAQSTQPKRPFTAEQVRSLHAYQHVLGLATNETTCPLCRGAADVPKLRRDVQVYLDRQDAYDVQLAAWAADTSNVQPGPVEPRDPKAIADEYAKLVAEFERIGAQLSECAATLAEIDALDAAEVHPQGPDPAAILGAAEQAEASWERATAKRSDLLAAQQRAAMLELVHKEMQRVVDLTFKERVSACVEGVSRYLPEGYGLEVMLNAPNGTRVFKFGLRVPEGHVEWNPSGGKRLALLLALAVWLIEQKRVPTPDDGIVVVMPSEERAFSPDWLGMVMTALAPAPVQIVLCNLVKPTYRGKAWSVVELGAVKAKGKGKDKAPSSTTDTDPLALSWEDVRHNAALREQFAAAIPVASGDRPTEGVQFERVPHGDRHINNCAIANLDEERSCQVCGGDCPDRTRLARGDAPPPMPAADESPDEVDFEA